MSPSIVLSISASSLNSFVAAIGPLVRKPSTEPSGKTPAKTPFAKVVQARESTPVSSSPYMKLVLVVGFK